MHASGVEVAMSSMLEPFIPHPRVLERERVAVVADVAKAWRVIRHVDAYRSSFVRALFALRRLPDLLTGRLTEVKAALTPHASIDDFAAPGSDFQLLADAPEQGFVVGAVGRFWQPHLEFRHVAPHDFAAFQKPGYDKLAWGLSVTKRRSGGSWVTFELRVAQVDEEREAAFERAWPLIAPFSHAIRTSVLGLVQQQLGPIDPAHVSLPGDLLGPARVSRTSSIVIEAPPAQVWPWLAQMGCGRAGWYGLDTLDNGGVPSAVSIHPEWQELTPGQRIAATPDGRSELEVLVVDPGRALVLGSPLSKDPNRSSRAESRDAVAGEPSRSSRAESRDPDAGEPSRSSRAESRDPVAGEPSRSSRAESRDQFKLTWAFVLEAIGDDACWLGVRLRANYEPSVDVALRHGWEALVHQAAQHAQLQHLKERAERAHA